MYYGTIEEQKQRLLSDAARERKTAAQISRLKAVIKQFDGKMYNCKLDNAIKALSDENGRFYAYNSYQSYYICFAPSRFGSVNDNILVSCRSAATCATVDRESYSFKTWEKNFPFSATKRIDAEKFNVLLNERYEQLLKSAADLEYAAENAEKILDQVSALQKQLNAVKNSIPYHAQEILNIK